jgi:hypothetical protein
LLLVLVAGLACAAPGADYLSADSPVVVLVQLLPPEPIGAVDLLHGETVYPRLADCCLSRPAENNPLQTFRRSAERIALDELLGGGSFVLFFANQQPTKVFSVAAFIATHVITTLPALCIISSQAINGCNLTFLKGPVFSYGVILCLVRARNAFYIGVYEGGPVRARA